MYFKVTYVITQSQKWSKIFTPIYTITIYVTLLSVSIGWQDFGLLLQIQLESLNE